MTLWYDMSLLLVGSQNVDYGQTCIPCEDTKVMYDLDYEAHRRIWCMRIVRGGCFRDGGRFKLDKRED
jgi:hypothetical protein